MCSRFLNASAPFTTAEYNAVWKHPKYAPWGFDEYKDFQARHLLSFGTLVILTSRTRLIIPLTRLVNSRRFGITAAPSSLCRLMDARTRTSINMATRKLSVSIQIGNVNYLNSPLCRIVFVNGSLVSWLSLRSSVA